MKTNRNQLSLYAFYFMAYLGVAIQTAFLNLYLNNFGLSSTLIGIINGLVQILTLITSPIWGKLADQAKNKNFVLIIGMIISCVSLVLFYLSNSIFALSVATVLFLTINNPLTGIYESITMSITEANGWSYGPIRMTGTISYAIMAYLTGSVLSTNQDLLFPIYLVSLIFNTITAFLLPKVKGVTMKENNSNSSNVFSLLKNKRIRNVLILFFVYTLGSTVNSSYFGIYMIELGGDYKLVGIAQMLLALSEIPFHIGPGAKWFKRIGIEKSMLVMTTVGVIRWIIVGTCSNPYILMFSMLLNGVMLVPTIVGLVEFIHDEAPDNMKATAQTALKSTFQISAQLFINFVGGILIGYIDNLGYSGIKYLYLSLSPICLIATIVIGYQVFYSKKEIH